jgi:hypothetical protein
MHSRRPQLSMHRRALAAAVLALASGLLLAPGAFAATRLISPSGGDAGNCTSSPCRSFGYAYQQSGEGDVIDVAAGSYGAQSVPGGSKAVTFRGTAGTKLSELDNYAGNVTFDTIEVDGGFAVNNTFENHDAPNVTYRNSRIGNVADEKAALVSGPDFTFDNMVFHDAVLKTDGTHMECVYAIVVPGMTVRNSLFYSCGVMDLFFTYGDWWTPKPPAYGNVTLENNVFAHSTMENNAGWHYYGLFVGNTGPNGSRMDGWVVRNNTFETPVGLSTQGVTAANSRWVGNLGSWDCISGIAYKRNVGDKCGPTDKAVAPSSSSSSRTAAFGWADPASNDFSLKPGSPAVGAADATDAPATDRDGKLRDGAPDAGALEYGPGGTPGAGPPATTPPPAPAPAPRKPAGLRFTSARLGSAVLCRAARRGCPAATSLAVRLDRTARVTVRLERVRPGRKAAHVRTFRFTATRARKARIRARGLRAGRYRVVLTARAANGARAKARTLRLRVR